MASAKWHGSGFSIARKTRSAGSLAVGIRRAHATDGCPGSHVNRAGHIGGWPRSGRPGSWESRRSPGIYLHRAGQCADHRQHLAGHVRDRPVRRERDVSGSSVAVLGDDLVGPQVQRDGQRTGAVWCWQRECLPAAYRQAHRGVLQLGFGRSERRGQLAQNLGVGVQGVAGGTPGVVGERRPFRGHAPSYRSPAARSGRRGQRPASNCGPGLCARHPGAHRRPCRGGSGRPIVGVC